MPTCDAELTAPIVSKEILRKEPLIDVAEGNSIYSERCEYRILVH